MSIPLATLRTLLSSKAKVAYRSDVQNYVLGTISAKHSEIAADLGKQPTGAVLVQDLHMSRSDSKPHWTVDIYTDKGHGIHTPSGCVHVYGDNSVHVYDTPRRALAAVRTIVEGCHRG
ncbi:hypothetical protein NEOLEDRAFT_916580 [Neolentinus lepideus HHB14362 ss-1]|uniref:Uncharacterized protein n=1 Tax=Neolentinus lepideus HHB14362 ss-1 TaxID=1314782 RepID=A0A165ULK3_9AGAM|nr:hypothetical protein NEOLEDRAFT_916580 [Neolentinus lepideus HHB14362 ss-1]